MKRCWHVHIFSWITGCSTWVKLIHQSLSSDRTISAIELWIVFNLPLPLMLPFLFWLWNIQMQNYSKSSFSFIPFMDKCFVFTLTFLTVVISEQRRRIFQCLICAISMADHQSSNGVTSEPLNMSQNTVLRSDRNPHFWIYNLSTQLIRSSMQFIISILADD